MQGNWEEALNNYQEALKIAEELGDADGKATYQNNTFTYHKYHV